MSKAWENELMKALMLVRDLRFKAVIQDIDPRATRAALKYMMMVDDYLMKKHGMSEEEDQKLTEIAEELFKQTPKELVKRFG